MRRILLATAAVLLAAPAAFAQSDSELADRLGRLERDVNFLQKQVYAGNGSPENGGTPAITGDGAAQIQVRLTQMEEEIRALRGQVETAQYNAGQAARDTQKLREDMEYRLGALEQAQSAAKLAAAAGTQADAAAAPAVQTPAEQPKPDEAATAEVNDKPATYKPGEKAATGADFPDANAAYNAAFKELNAKNYSAAATDFDAFVRKYPKDPLTSNAYYWLGESYYARGDYTRAAEGFRKGFESNPQGQKAPDNLLKLAMSLDNIKRTSEACIVLNQIVSKYGDSAPHTKERADAERMRMQCK